MKIACYGVRPIEEPFVADYTFKAALAVTVIPFIPADLTQMIISIISAPLIKKIII